MTFIFINGYIICLVVPTYGYSVAHVGDRERERPTEHLGAIYLLHFGLF